MKIFLINPTLHEFSFNQIGEEDVVNVIDKLPSKTSSGVDGISTNLLKDIQYIIMKLHKSCRRKANRSVWDFWNLICRQGNGDRAP